MPDQAPKPLDYQARVKSRPIGKVLAWTGFGLVALVTVFLSLLGMIGLITSPAWACVFVIGAVVLIALGIMASRFLRWPGALAGVIVCVCIVGLLLGTCNQIKFEI